jgi:hypothetical protein
MIDVRWKEKEVFGSVQSAEQEGWEYTERSSPFV